MAYCNNKAQEKARYLAVTEVRNGRSVAQVARRFGCFRSTIYRWIRKYEILLDSKEINSSFRHIPTASSRPNHSPRSLDQSIVDRIIAIRLASGRTAEVIWAEARLSGLNISLASVHRILKRARLTRESSKWKRKRTFSPRPHADYPGALVEVDTVHFFHPITRERRYATSVIDVYSRMAYVKINENMQQYNAVEAILAAQKRFGFRLHTVQTDNGCEFGKKFQDEITRRGIKYRHKRVRKPNDNAHVEIFNRTLREECLGNYLPDKESIFKTQQRVSRYLDYYNTKRLHLGIQLRTPLMCCKGIERS